MLGISVVLCSHLKETLFTFSAKLRALKAENRGWGYSMAQEQSQQECRGLLLRAGECAASWGLSEYFSFPRQQPPELSDQEDLLQSRGESAWTSAQTTDTQKAAPVCSSEATP
jgi:hypothetical protein